MPQNLVGREGVTACQPSFAPLATSRLRPPPSPAVLWIPPAPVPGRPSGLAVALLPYGWERDGKTDDEHFAVCGPPRPWTATTQARQNTTQAHLNLAWCAGLNGPVPFYPILSYSSGADSFWESEQTRRFPLFHTWQKYQNLSHLAAPSSRRSRLADHNLNNCCRG